MPRILPLLAALVVACGPVDEDMDGFSAEVDCNDRDNLVFPGGNEVCDGIDNDCNGVIDDPYASGGTVWFIDSDGDGYGSTSGTAVSCTAPEGYANNAADCDDTLDSTFPGADELCNGRDDDCDRTIDDNAVDAPVWHADWDQDGYGSETKVQRSCEAPPGYISDASDCNDFDIHVNPVAVEVCDFIDNDCDDTVDEPDAEDARDWYRDADGDGFGNIDEPQRACWLPDGYADLGTDCNDEDAMQAPDMPEICLDGLDNNCNGGPDHCDVSAWTDVSAADRSWQGPRSSAYLGGDVKVVGDLDGDGFDDLLGGAWYDYQGSNFGEGAAYIIYGDDAEMDEVESVTSDPAITGSGRYTYAGRAVGAAGDIDGDGYADALIGAYGAASRAGEVYVLYGDPSRRSGRTRGSTLPTFRGNSSSNLGYAVGGEVDLDGDGYDDIAMGAWRDSSWTGAIYIAYGGTERFSGTTSVTSGSDLRINGKDRFGYLGAEGSLARGGDFDGDGYGDMILGAYRDTGATLYSGAAYIHYGDATRAEGTISTRDFDDKVDGEAFFQYLGGGNGSVGDINGDGYDDMGIGCYGCEGYAGTLYVFFGDATRLGEKAGSDADVSIIGSSRAYLGRYAPTSGDFNGDGTDDLAVGGYYASPSGTRYAGEVAVLTGAADLSGDYDTSSGDLSTVIEGPTTPFSYLGKGIGAGDFNGDGVDDLAAGAERVDGSAGRVYLFLGTSL